MVSTQSLGLTHLLHSPEFKRLAAIQGDQAMQSGRRFAFSKWATTQNVWSFCSFSHFRTVSGWKWANT